MVKYREIIRQKAMGVSVRNIAFSCKCSTATVRTVVDRARQKGLEWPLPEEMNDAAIRAVLYPRKPKVDAAKAECFRYAKNEHPLPVDRCFIETRKPMQHPSGKCKRLLELMYHGITIS